MEQHHQLTLEINLRWNLMLKVSTTIMNDLTRPFTCEACGRSFTRQENLKRHTRSHHQSSTSRKYGCSWCTASFMRSDLRKRHMEHCHAAALQQEQRGEVENAARSPLSPSRSRNAPINRSSLRDKMPDRSPMTADTRVEADELPSETAYAATFLGHFHRSFPFLHEPTFSSSSPPLALLRATACIGALHSRSQQSTSISRSLFKSGVEALSKYVQEDRSRYQCDWVLQSFILYELYGLYSGDEALSQKATNIHTNLVDNVRLYQMAQTIGDESSDFSADQLTGLDEAELEQSWLYFIKSETRKRSIYALYLLDTQRAVLCNLRPILSSLEIKHPLPCDEDLWLAPSAQEWAALMAQRFTSFNDCEDFLAFEENMPQSSFYASTQYLLHTKPTKDTPSKLRLLWSSPLAALILVTQLQMVVRELTHAACLLERPTFQQRLLSLLTETQYSQISQALRSIAELVPKSEFSATGPSSPNTWRSWPAAFSLAHPLSSPASQVDTQQSHAGLWHYFWMMWHYTWITLSHPDALIVRGIVESSLPGSIATACHLGKPRAKGQRDIYEDRDVFRLLNSLDQSLRQLASTSEPQDEHPFATLLGFKVSLVGWRLVRLTMSDLSKPSSFVLDTILQACGQQAMYSQDSTAAAEVTYLRWLVQDLEQRNVWPVGYWTGQVLREMAQESENLGAIVDTALGSAVD